MIIDKIIYARAMSSVLYYDCIVQLDIDFTECNTRVSVLVLLHYDRCYDHYCARCCACEEEDDAKAGLRCPGKLEPTVDAFLCWLAVLAGSMHCRETSSQVLYST